MPLTNASPRTPVAPVTAMTLDFSENECVMAMNLGQYATKKKFDFLHFTKSISIWVYWTKDWIFSK
jgi:hypothetical protein